MFDRVLHAGTYLPVTERMKLYTYIIISLITVMEAGIFVCVRITPVTRPVGGKERDCVVILPCNFTTDTYETPQISWYKDNDIQVMTYDVKNRLISYHQFTDRVSRGNSGNLVIHGPTLSDTGDYSCEVEVDRESPSWAKANVKLVIASKPVTTTSLEISTGPTAPVNGHEISIGPIIPLEVHGGRENIWIVAFQCAGWILLTICALVIYQCLGLRRLKDGLSKCNCKLLPFVIGAGVVILAMIMLITSNVYTAYFFTSLTSQEKEHNWRVSLSTVLTAIVFYVVFLLLYLIFKSCGQHMPTMVKKARSPMAQGVRTTVERANQGSPPLFAPEGDRLLKSVDVSLPHKEERRPDQAADNTNDGDKNGDFTRLGSSEFQRRVKVFEKDKDFRNKELQENIATPSGHTYCKAGQVDLSTNLQGARYSKDDMNAKADLKTGCPDQSQSAMEKTLGESEPNLDGSFEDLYQRCRNDIGDNDGNDVRCDYVNDSGNENAESTLKDSDSDENVSEQPNR